MLKNTLIFLSGLALSSCMQYVEKDPPHAIAFVKAPCVQPHDGYRYRLCNDMHVEIDNVEYIVPEGFDTDFASIPQHFWWHTAPHQADLAAPSILHDYMYACPGNQSRRYADDVFYSALLENGVTGNRAIGLYYVVRAGGLPFFKRGSDCSLEAAES